MKAYFLGIAAAAMAVAILSSLLRKGVLRQVFLLAGGVLVTLQVLSPLARGELQQFGQYLSGLEIRQDAIQSGIEVENQEILSQIIREKTEAYIWDKAAALGASVQVEVEVRQGSQYPFPWSCKVTGLLTPEQQRQLSEDLSRSLAIPEERQVFSS